MLIYFFSDRNYVRQGFLAKFSIVDCPYNCSGHGLCSSERCICDPSYTGLGCQFSVCPNECNHGGTCVSNECNCFEGYGGLDCGLQYGPNAVANKWTELTPFGFIGSPIGRTGHRGAYIANGNVFCIFGGFTLVEVLNDLNCFSFDQNQWNPIEYSVPWPSARYDYALAVVPDGFYIFGGIVSPNDLVNDLWYYEWITKSWTLVAQESVVQPQPLASATLTVVDDTWLYLFGGRSAEGSISSSLYRISIDELHFWEEVRAVGGGKSADRRLAGHATVFHSALRSLIVFGGFTVDYARFPKRNKQVQMYNVDANMWMELNYDTRDGSAVPDGVVFHTMTLVGNYLVIFGGNSHTHHTQEICYDNDVFLFHLNCMCWVSIDDLDALSPGEIGMRSRNGFFNTIFPFLSNYKFLTRNLTGMIILNRQVIFFHVCVIYL